MGRDEAVGEYDSVIVGAGSAGCVLAEKLSRDPRQRVLLIKAGPTDNNPLIHMPKGLGTLGDPRYVWQIEAEPSGKRNIPEVWHPADLAQPIIMVTDASIAGGHR